MTRSNKILCTMIAGSLLLPSIAFADVCFIGERLAREDRQLAPTISLSQSDARRLSGAGAEVQEGAFGGFYIRRSDLNNHLAQTNCGNDAVAIAMRRAVPQATGEGEAPSPPSIPAGPTEPEMPPYEELPE